MFKVGEYFNNDNFSLFYNKKYIPQLWAALEDTRISLVKSQGFQNALDMLYEGHQSNRQSLFHIWNVETASIC